MKESWGGAGPSRMKMRSSMGHHIKAHITFVQTLKPINRMYPRSYFLKLIWLVVISSKDLKLVYLRLFEMKRQQTSKGSSFYVNWMEVHLCTLIPSLPSKTPSNKDKITKKEATCKTLVYLQHMCANAEPK